jgi:hypothetical protein
MVRANLAMQPNVPLNGRHILLHNVLLNPERSCCSTAIFTLTPFGFFAELNQSRLVSNGEIERFRFLQNIFTNGFPQHRNLATAPVLAVG